MTNPEVLNAYSLHKAAKQMNLKCTIQETLGQVIGVQQSQKERLNKRLEYILSCDLTFQQQKIKVKITGDGAVVSKSIHALIISFTLVNVKSEECPNSPRENHVLAQLKIITICKKY